jgi:hypothetical protein
MAIIESGAGQEYCFVWEHEGKQCPFIHLTDPKLVKSYADYGLIDEDLRQSRECFHLLATQPIDNFTVAASLLANGVVTYMRPFTVGEARNTRLDPKGVFAKAKDLRGIHDEIAAMRHKLFAHAGGSAHEGISVCLALHPDMQSGPVEIYRGFHRVNAFKPEWNANVIKIIDWTLDWVKRKIDDSYKRMRKILWSENVSSLYDQAVVPQALPPHIVRIVSNERHDVT